MNTTINTVRTDSFEMRYFRFGTLGKQPVIILPGLSIKSVMESADAIAGAYSILSGDFDVYVFDRRTDLPKKYTIRDMARDTAQAIELLGLKKVDIFGASQGGAIAQVIAIEYPELVSAIILGSSTSRVDVDESELALWVKMAEEKDLDGLIVRFAKQIYSPAFYEKYSDLIMFALSDITDEELERFIILAKGMEGFDVYGELDKIKCPVLVIGAGDDKVVGTQASIDIAEKTGGELYIYEGYGHAVYDEAPDYTQRIYDFFIKGKNNGEQ